MVFRGRWHAIIMYIPSVSCKVAGHQVAQEQREINGGWGKKSRIFAASYREMDVTSSSLLELEYWYGASTPDDGTR